MVNFYCLFILITGSRPSNSELTVTNFFAEYRDQLIALGIILGALDSASRAFANLKADLDEEKAV
jgi:hypothetical protein